MVIWFEIYVDEIERAINFYSAVFKVALEQKKFGDNLYAVFPALNKGIAGVLTQGKIQSGNTVLFFYTADMSVSIETIVYNGGKIIQPKTLIKNTDVNGNSIIPRTLIDGNTGYYAYFSDTEGNKMGLYSNS
jgi:uncharacterized protein